MHPSIISHNTTTYTVSEAVSVLIAFLCGKVDLKHQAKMLQRGREERQNSEVSQYASAKDSCTLQQSAATTQMSTKYLVGTKQSATTTEVEEMTIDDVGSSSSLPSAWAEQHPAQTVLALEAEPEALGTSQQPDLEHAPGIVDDRAHSQPLASEQLELLEQIVATKAEMQRRAEARERRAAARELDKRQNSFQRRKVENDMKVVEEVLDEGTEIALSPPPPPPTEGQPLRSSSFTRPVPVKLLP